MISETFIIKFDYKNPIELSDFSDSLNAIASEFKSYALKEGLSINSDEIKLYIYEIEKGSIIARIKAMHKHIDSFVLKEKIVKPFMKKTQETIDYFLAKVDLKPELSIENLQNIKKIVQPSASDGGTNLTFIAEQGSVQHITLTIDHVEANAIQHRIDHELGLLKLPNNQIRTKVLFYCYQARNDKKTKAGDMGIIENITTKPVKTIYNDPELKEKILKNPFDFGFIVDVEVSTVNGTPKLYKVLKLHDLFEI